MLDNGLDMSRSLSDLSIPSFSERRPSILSLLDVTQTTCLSLSVIFPFSFEPYEFVNLIYTARTRPCSIILRAIVSAAPGVRSVNCVP